MYFNKELFSKVSLFIHEPAAFPISERWNDTLLPMIQKCFHLTEATEDAKLYQQLQTIIGAKNKISCPLKKGQSESKRDAKLAKEFHLRKHQIQKLKKYNLPQIINAALSQLSAEELTQKENMGVLTVLQAYIFENFETLYKPFTLDSSKIESVFLQVLPKFKELIILPVLNYVRTRSIHCGNFPLREEHRVSDSITSNLDWIILYPQLTNRQSGFQYGIPLVTPILRRDFRYSDFLKFIDDRLSQEPSLMVIADCYIALEMLPLTAEDFTIKLREFQQWSANLKSIVVRSKIRMDDEDDVESCLFQSQLLALLNPEKWIDWQLNRPDQEFADTPNLKDQYRTIKSSLQNGRISTKQASIEIFTSTLILRGATFFLSGKVFVDYEFSDELIRNLCTAPLKRKNITDLLSLKLNQRQLEIVLGALYELGDINALDFIEIIAGSVIPQEYHSALLYTLCQLPHPPSYDEDTVEQLKHVETLIHTEQDRNQWLKYIIPFLKFPDTAAVRYPPNAVHNHMIKQALDYLIKVIQETSQHNLNYYMRMRRWFNDYAPSFMLSDGFVVGDEEYMSSMTLFHDLMKQINWPIPMLRALQLGLAATFPEPRNTALEWEQIRLANSVHRLLERKIQSLSVRQSLAHLLFNNIVDMKHQFISMGSDSIDFSKESYLELRRH